MSSTADGRVFHEEEPTGQFDDEQLEALRARSLEKSAVLNPAVDVSSSGVMTAPYPVQPGPPKPRPPTPTSPEFLGKGAAVLVLPSEPPPPAPPAPAPAPPPPAVIVDVPAPPRVVARPATPAAPLVVPVAPVAPAVRTRRSISSVVARPRRRVWRQVFKLALLALVVFCQPWWWNVGDLHARPPAPKSNVNVNAK